MSPMRRPQLVALTLLATVLAACRDDAGPPAHLQVAGGEPERGRSLIQSYGCGTCHTIEGVPGARGRAGPNLSDYASRSMLAGIMPNTPPLLVAWLVDPVAMEPRTAMPAMGITEAEARHIAAYLYTLGGSGVDVYPAEPPLEREGRKAVVLPGRQRPVSAPAQEP